MRRDGAAQELKASEKPKSADEADEAYKIENRPN